MWSYIFTAVVGIWLYSVFSSINKRIQALEDERGPGFSTSFNINAIDAIIRNEHFAKLTGIKSASKPFGEWTKADKELWEKKFSENISRKAFVHFHYLAGENVYFVSTNNNGSNLSRFVNRDGITNLLYSAVVAGDEDGYDPRLEFLVYERIVKTNNGGRIWVLSPCLKYREGMRKKDFQILFNYPLHRLDMDDDQYKALGFEVERFGGDDVFTNDFDEMEGRSAMVDYKKNGAEISFRY